MKTEQPLWGRGTMISPQHFQQQSAWQAWQSECIARMGLNQPWGLLQAEFEPEALKLGRLQPRHLHLRFSDGTLVDTHNADPLPPTLTLKTEQKEVTVVLALPQLYANGGNCLQESDVAERPVRFRQRWRDIRNLFGDDTRQVAVLQPELTLRYAHQDNSDWLTCPVARLQQDAQGGWALDSQFLPPLLTLQSSPWLMTALEQLVTQLRARLVRLMAMRRESNQRMADFAVADVSLFWLLNALNSAEPLLADFQRHPQSPPERLYPELARLAGSLLTFSLEHQVSAIPVYRHENLNEVFPPLFSLLGTLLEASLPSRMVVIDMTHDSRLRQWQARLN
ncbi:type VI secretion system baseplate subunit TssK, partial [Pantoea endophytica]